MSKLRKDDKVVVISGNDKGRSGTVLSRNGDKAVVQGLNVRKKHVKAQRGQPGQIIDIEAPMHVSNLMVCNAEGKPMKLKTRCNEDGSRELYYKEGDEEITYRTLKKAKGQ
jgi:large subunit ribosomal protein L24